MFDALFDVTTIEFDIKSREILNTLTKQADISYDEINSKLDKSVVMYEVITDKCFAYFENKLKTEVIKLNKDWQSVPFGAKFFLGDVLLCSYYSPLSRQDKFKIQKSLDDYSVEVALNYEQELIEELF